MHNMVLADHQINSREIEEAVCISKERVVPILDRKLGMKKETFYKKGTASAQSPAKTYSDPKVK